MTATRAEPGTAAEVERVIARVHLEQWARVVGGLVRRFGDLDLAEDMAAEAFATAVERWPVEGVPANPGGWITTTASRRAVDWLRREERRRNWHQEAAARQAFGSDTPAGVIDDDRLRLMFTCSHPALKAESRTALTLRLVGGLTVAQIARAFLVSESTIGKRITRAKAKIAAAGIPFRIPSQADLQTRVDAVLGVLFVVFNEGYLTSEPGQGLDRADLTTEAIRLARLCHELLPSHGETAGLLALMLLTTSRRPARIGTAGELITLDRQDRQSWDTASAAEGFALIRERLRSVAAGQSRPGRYQLLAAINAVHTSSPTFADTDWVQIVALYDQLIALDPSPIVALNRAIAVAELDGPHVALPLIERLDLHSYHAFHVTRADLLDRLHRPDEARSALDQALALAPNQAQRATLLKRFGHLAMTS